MSRGGSQSGMKAYNERLALSLMRRHGRLSKVEMARITGLSAQTSSVIMKQLEQDGLVLKLPPQRGKVGQPLVPFTLNPEGAYAIGFKFGRRSAALMLMDLVGTARAVLRTTYAYPEPLRLESFVRAGVEGVTRALSAAQKRRICGLGIAAPFEMWSWEDEVGTPAAIRAAWRRYDIAREVAAMVPWPVHFYKDSTAACAAELSFGGQARHQNFLYVFIATLIGGGVVLDGSLYPGRSGYAGSFGSVLVPDPSGRRPAQRLIRCASLYLLENRLREAGRDPAVLGDVAGWGDIGPILEGWVEQVADSVSLAIGSAIAVIDFEAVVIDGAVPAAVRADLVARIRRKTAAIDLQGVAGVEIVEGRVGPDARVLGAASLPLRARFERDRELLFLHGAQAAARV